MENIRAESDNLTWWLMIKFPDQGKWEMAGIYMAIFNVSSRAYLAKSPEMRARLILTMPPPIGRHLLDIIWGKMYLYMRSLTLLLGPYQQPQPGHWLRPRWDTWIIRGRDWCVLGTKKPSLLSNDARNR